jgi:hypothetical protein
MYVAVDLGFEIPEILKLDSITPEEVKLSKVDEFFVFNLRKDKFISLAEGETPEEVKFKIPHLFI